MAVATICQSLLALLVALPMTVKMARRGEIDGRRAAARLALQILVPLALFAVATWAMYEWFSRHTTAYWIGMAMSGIPTLLRSRKENEEDFIRGYGHLMVEPVCSTAATSSLVALPNATAPLEPRLRAQELVYAFADLAAKGLPRIGDVDDLPACMNEMDAAFKLYSEELEETGDRWGELSDVQGLHMQLMGYRRWHVIDAEDKQSVQRLNRMILDGVKWADLPGWAKALQEKYQSRTD